MRFFSIELYEVELLMPCKLHALKRSYFREITKNLKCRHFPIGNVHSDISTLTILKSQYAIQNISLGMSDI